MRNRRYLLFLWLLSLPCIAEGAAIQWSGNGHWYEAVSVPGGITWFEARDAAAAAGGYLATIDEEYKQAEENAFVFDLIDDDIEAYWRKSYVLYGPWLGGYQREGFREPGNGWIWISGEDFCSYTNWRKNQPSDTGGNQDHLHYVAAKTADFTPASTWNDTYGGETEDCVISYVIEYDTNPVPEPTSFVLFTGLGLAGAITCRRRQKSTA